MTEAKTCTKALWWPHTMMGARTLWWPELACSMACSGAALRASEARAPDAADGQQEEPLVAAATISGGGLGGGTRLSSRCARCPALATPDPTALCLRRPRRARLGLLLRLGVLAAAVSAITAQQESAQITTRWCNSDNEPSDPRVEVCFEPSVGPIDGGVLVTVKGMQRAAAAQQRDWQSRCSDRNWWQCTFAKPEGKFASPVPVLTTSCRYNYVVCESPAQTISGDVFVSVTRNDSGGRWSFPSPSGEQPIFSYYGIAKIEPIAGIAGMRPAVDIVLLNRKEGIENWNCKYTTYGPGWNKSNALPPIRAAGFKMETKRLTCGVPDDILKLENEAPWAQVN